MTLLNHLLTMAGSCAVTFGLIAGTARAWTTVRRAIERRQERERRITEILETISERLSRLP